MMVYPASMITAAINMPMKIMRNDRLFMSIRVAG
jgi:hypothetical protein